jgi:formylmethanofuran dehydrogenase subunit B
VQLSDSSHPCGKPFADASIATNSFPTPLVSGKPDSEKEALEKAAVLLSAAKLPLVNGLIADVQACREAVALTEKLGGVIDHANGRSIRKGLAVMQRIGEVRTTLAEVRNRADCIVIFGAGVTDRFPRLKERVLSPTKTLGSENTNNKKIFILDVSDDGTTHTKTDNNVTHVNLNYPRLESIIYRFQEVVTRPKEYFLEHNAELDPEHDKDTQQLFNILETILNSQYTTLVWSVGDFNQESAEHTVQALTESIKILMKTIRCVGLPLGGSKAEITASQVATWQTGVPLPVSFTQGTPIHNPVLYDGESMLKNQEADCLLWIATYNSDDVPPKHNGTTIVLGHPNMNCESADVYLPVGVPGIDHRGLACRTDNVATLPLHKIRDSKLPAASKLINKLIELL